MDYDIEEYNIGDIIKDDKRDLTIVDKKLVKRSWYYKYRCNVCGYECEDGYRSGKFVRGIWYKAYELRNTKKGCACCNHKIIVPEINSIRALRPDLSIYFINNDDIKYAPQSGIKIDVKCPDCGHIKENQTISILNNYGFSCPVCSVSVPIGERIVCSLLDYLNIPFKKEFQFDGSNKRYDFYIEHLNTIIEVNGRQHYQEIPGNFGIRDEFANDKLKYEFAMDKGISNYIIIDAQESNFDYIKQSILASPLSDIMDLCSINWSHIKELINQNGKVKEMCEYWETHPEVGIADMEQKFHYSEAIVYRHLAVGYDNGWCHKREPKKQNTHIKQTLYERKNPIDNYHKDSRNNSVPIKHLPTSTYYKNARLASENSEEYIGKHNSISTVRYKAKRGKEYMYIARREFNKAYDEGCVCVGTPFDDIVLDVLEPIE